MILPYNFYWFRIDTKNMPSTLIGSGSDGIEKKCDGRLSTSLAAKGCVLSTQQERSFKWIDTSE